MDICEQYKEQVARLYGQDCADTSLVAGGNDCFLINVAVAGPDGQELQGLAQPHTHAQLEKMIANLSRRKPGLILI